MKVQNTVCFSGGNNEVVQMKAGVSRGPAAQRGSSPRRLHACYAAHAGTANPGGGMCSRHPAAAGGRRTHRLHSRLLRQLVLVHRTAPTSAPAQHTLGKQLFAYSVHGCLSYFRPLRRRCSLHLAEEPGSAKGLNIRRHHGKNQLPLGAPHRVVVTVVLPSTCMGAGVQSAKGSASAISYSAVS